MSQPALTVGVVCHFPPPPGGMPGQAEALSRGLIACGVDVVRIPTNLHGSRLGLAIDSVRVLRSCIRLPVFLARLARALPKVGILHILSCCGLYFFLFSVPPLVLGRWLGRRVILNYRGGEAREFFARWPRFVRWAVAHADVIIVPSQFLREVFAEIGFEAHVIENGCNLSVFERAVPASIEPTFIVARHLEPLYNIGCVLRAFQLIVEHRHDARLLVLGGGSEEGRLKSLAVELGIERAVTFLGYVPFEQTPVFYRRAGIALNGSNIDNTPNAILEAFAAGMPMVSTRAGGIPYLIDEGVTGFLVALDDHRAMAERACWLLDHQEAARTMAERAKERAQRHSWSAVLRKWVRLYSETGYAKAGLVAGEVSRHADRPVGARGV